MMQVSVQESGKEVTKIMTDHWIGPIQVMGQQQTD
jgi:hypothetical protein